ncbi:GntR family transcriptional regulator [Halalkalibacter alkalisediminis]|uniref:GntR family transcriptional regulator n=1 Tax=Halalkalibacter alkalisediminis TaxID=935616 RepID=A0ABV6NEH0_9BACI|nr:GntR family transcriptional regulator [Halalkalibacter alkalisediminis]
MKLNSSTSQPLYIQLKEIIKSDIKSGQYTSNQQLPTETDLCDQYSVSRITARRAITDLVEEGFLERRQGKGTFVKRRSYKRELISVNGFSEHMLQVGRKPRSQVLSCLIISANEKTADSLSISTGDPILELKRINYIDSEPFGLDTSYYSLTRFPRLERYITQSDSTYQTLSTHYNIEIAHNSRILNVVFANHNQAELLNCDLGTPLFYTEKIAYDKDMIPIHSSSLYIQADKATFTINTSNLGNK